MDKFRRVMVGGCVKMESWMDTLRNGDDLEEGCKLVNRYVYLLVLVVQRANGAGERLAESIYLVWLPACLSIYLIHSCNLTLTPLACLSLLSAENT